MAAFTCDIFAYQVVQPELSPGVFGNSQFRKINTVNGYVEIITYDTGFKINAIGYNTLDNFIYGFATIDLRPTLATFGQMVDPTAGYILATPPYYTSLNPLVSTTADWAYNPVDGQLYAVLNDESQFISVNPTNGVVTFQPTISYYRCWFM